MCVCVLIKGVDFYYYNYDAVIDVLASTDTFVVSIET